MNRAGKRHPSHRHALHAIAIYEGIKGVAALAASIGLMELLHHDLRRITSELIGHFGLDPVRHYPALLLHYIDLLNNTNIRSLVLLALAYAVLRLAEAYGLWRERAWGEWLGAASGGLYLPLEIYHLSHRLTWPGAIVFLANLSMVAFLLMRLWRRRSEAVPFVSGSV
ncbi:DUF2127 domain-containing protein [Pararobbsia alpina]|uniref:DUF2127 domain-containing protein n=1 Tax=Pararobbsia alpina TaxID=621374 RepID=A0A6S7B301_9BURK|nr:DUF2127 domain-containing protein [Pararobbsia alpina]CAB3786087.1 hypothetical protein LMG28138_02162 [Pararobbsia alpina]